MSELDPLTQPQTSTNCDSSFSSRSVTLTLNAPLAALTSNPVPNNFRSMAKLGSLSRVDVTQSLRTN